MEYYFTSDAWPKVKTMLEQAGIKEYQRLRLDLANPDAGWQPVTTSDMQVREGITDSDKTLIVYGLGKFIRRDSHG